MKIQLDINVNDVIKEISIAPVNGANYNLDEFEQEQGHLNDRVNKAIQKLYSVSMQEHEIEGLSDMIRGVGFTVSSKYSNCHICSVDKELRMF